MSSILERFGIRTKILALLIISSVIGLTIAVQGSHGIKTMDVKYSDLTDHSSPATLRLARVNGAILDMVYAGYRTMAYDGGSRTARESAQQEEAAYKGAVKALEEARQFDPSMADKAAEIEQQLSDIHDLVSSAVQHGLKNENDTAREILTQADAKVKALSAAIIPYNEKRIADGVETSAAMARLANSTSTSLLVIAVLGILGAMGAGIFVAQVGITRPLNRLKDVMRTLADNRTDVDVPGTRRGDELGAMAQTVLVFQENAIAKNAADAQRARIEAEQKVIVDQLEEKLAGLAIGKLDTRITVDVAPAYEAVRDNFNSAIDSLSQLVGSVLESASSIQTGAHEITRASEDLAHRTESNAANLEETSAAINEMEERLRATASAALESAQGAKAAMIAVAEGRGRTDEAVQAMGKVSESAKGIDNVIEGLDKIAFQTRVLAMNAAVEAGRAGDAGRGFAVVADLVSALAMRAEEEAKLARDQLTITQAEISSAVEAVGKVDSALVDISASGNKAAELSDQMASDNAAQSSAITQISTAISSMDAATQQNAAMVEQTSAAARTLNQEIGGLVQQASKFDLGGGKASTPAARGPAKPTSLPAHPVTSPTRKRAEKAAIVTPKLSGGVLAKASAGDDADWREF
ncbi:MAG: methyl-accepting chemotaxis protein [Sphingobium sp.]|nr:methyl-accepting chemotaxis protein [Sphingobium sp.]